MQQNTRSCSCGVPRTDAYHQAGRGMHLKYVSACQVVDVQIIVEVKPLGSSPGIAEQVARDSALPLGGNSASYGTQPQQGPIMDIHQIMLVFNEQTDKPVGNVLYFAVWATRSCGDGVCSLGEMRCGMPNRAQRRIANGPEDGSVKSFAGLPTHQSHTNSPVPFGPHGFPTTCMLTQDDVLDGIVEDEVPLTFADDCEPLYGCPLAKMPGVADAVRKIIACLH
jgi:hypothetical protein